MGLARAKKERRDAEIAGQVKVGKVGAVDMLSQFEWQFQEAGETL